MRIVFQILSAIFLVCATTGCYYDSEEELYPYANNNCDTTSVTYSGTIVSILTNRCYVCHGENTGPLNGNITLEGYDNLKTHLADGSLLGSIQHEPGFVPMPQDAAKIPDCEILQIKKWVSAGAPDN